jgi:multiple sugar transport system permease protein
MTTTSSSRGLGKQVVLYAILLLVLLWTLVPIIWMVLSSFKSGTDLLSSTPKIFFEPSLEHYATLFTTSNLQGYIWNSVLAAGISTIIAITLGCLAGYGLARSHFRGKRHVAFWIISTRMAPIAAVVLPLFILFRYANLLDSIPGLIVAYLTFNLPFAIWIMNAFFADLPPSLEEAAMVDGASRFQAFYRVALPLVTPGIVTTAILCLVFSWNDYAFAATFAGPDSQTLPIAAAQLNTQTGLNWGQLTAIGTIVVLPMMVVGLAVRRYLVRGLTLGAVTWEEGAPPRKEP